MRIEVLKSKIHRVKDTKSELHYAGARRRSDRSRQHGERKGNSSERDGERLETYVIKGERGTVVCLSALLPVKHRWEILLLFFPMLAWSLKKLKNTSQLLFSPMPITI